MHDAPRSIVFLALAVALALALALGMAGCRSSGAEPSVLDTPYAAPPDPAITVDSTQPLHRVVLDAPSGGWQFKLDQVRKRFGRFDAYFTVTRPDPTFNHTQAAVRHFAGTGVDRGIALRVHVRLIDPTPRAASRRDPSPELGPYRIVLDAPAAPARAPTPAPAEPPR